MAEALLFQPAMAIVSEVVKRVMDEFKSPWVTQKHLKKLEDKLLYLQALLHDAGSRSSSQNGAVVNLWLKRVMDVTHYVEDVLDEYGYEGLRKKVEVRSRFKLSGSFAEFSRTNPIAFKMRIAKKANKAMSSLEAIFKEAHDLGIKPVKLMENERILSTSAFEEYREERDFAGYTSGFIGRKHEESKIVEMLSNPSPGNIISVVAIVGIGGLGKTTLARRVYNNALVRVHFHKRVWICVSERFSIKRLLKEMVESLTASKCDMSNVEASERALQKELGGQRYLLVLDDVWNTDHGRWESLLSSLYGIGGSLGTIILATTRSHEVVEAVQAQAVHKLQKLSEEESWALFEQTVSRSEASWETPDLVVIGRRIVEKCKGVPLAIKMLGGLLRSKKNARAWRSIEQSEIWELSQDRFGILPSLLLSFYYLPSPVKQCFSYCALFPKDAVMSKSDMIRLWLAQGFLHHVPRSKSAEDIGEEYFNTLLSNSFLLLLDQERDDLGVDMECTMHDLVHDMAIFISQTDCLIWKEKNEMDNKASNVRHIALLRDNLGVDYEFSANRKLSKLRTVHTQISITNNFLLNTSNLRALKLSGNDLKEIPVAIGHLKHCRYLDLSGNAIKSLPESITELYNLQTLQLQGCRLLHQFPKGMSKLVNLRHLQTDKFVEMPIGMKSLTHLQTLPFLSLQDFGGGTIDEIGCLHDVTGVLYIQGLEYVANKEAAVKASIGKKAKIVALGLRWSAAKDTGSWACIRRYGMDGGFRRVKDGSTDEDVLDGLRPHPNLERLEVVDYEGKKFASWLERMTVVDEMGNKAPLNNLVSLFITNCKKCKKLPTLGQLPCLRDLRIKKMESVALIGLEFYVYCEDSSDNRGNVGKCAGRDALFFPALRTLRLSYLPALTEWLPPPKGTALPFPCLKYLEVLDCPCLITTPTQFPCLDRLMITRFGRGKPVEIITNNINNVCVHMLSRPQGTPSWEV